MADNVLIGNKYKLIKKLGSGAFGEIFLANHVASDDKFAIKIELKRNRH